MFLLSPLYLLTRLKPGFDKLSQEEKRKVVEDQHKVPAGLLNAVLSAVFAAETPMGHWIAFPWGTSVWVFSKNDLIKHGLIIQGFFSEEV